MRYQRSSRKRPSATIACRSRCVAATMRTSTWSARCPPTRSSDAVLQHAQQAHLRGERQLADLVEEERAAVGALEPALARRRCAPVKLPRSWPKSSESTRSAGIAPQLTRRNGPAARRERAWIARAITSLPEPVSPRISTGTSVGATCSTRSITRAGPRLAPTMVSLMSLRPSRESSARLSASRRLAQPRELVQAAVVLERDREAARAARARAPRARRRSGPRRAASSSTPRRLLAPGERAGEHVAVDALGQQPGQLAASALAAPCSSARCAPREERLELGGAELVARGSCGLRSGAAARVSTGARRARAAHQRAVERQPPRRAAGDCRSTASPISTCWQASRQTSSRSGRSAPCIAGSFDRRHQHGRRN